MRDDTKKRPRGRPRTFDEQTARGQLMERFWEKGYACVSLDDLSAATGIGRPSLYATFGDKEAMYLASLQQYSKQLVPALDQLQRTPSLESGLRDFYGNALQVYLSGESSPLGCMVVGTATAQAPTSPAIRAALAGLLEQLDAALGQFFRRFVPEPQAAARGRLAASLLHSLAIRARAGLPEASLHQLVEDTLAFLIL